MAKGIRIAAVLGFVLALSDMGQPAFGDELILGFCSLEEGPASGRAWCSPEDLAKLYRRKAQAEEQKRLDSDPAYRARQEAARREAERQAAEARRRDAAELADTMKRNGLSPQREAEARRLIELRKAAEAARGVRVDSVSPPPVTTATAAAPPKAPAPPKTCVKETKTGASRGALALSQADAMRQVDQDRRGRCGGSSTITRKNCWTQDLRMHVKVLPNGRSVKDDLPPDLRWFCEAEWRCDAPVERCTSGPVGSSRQ